ncbi:MAG: MBL fold metallo-hydrolase [Nitrospinae bacterium]|nr:MBL fold metallo-hydrolase [Nitrospinota bacterium]
MKRLYPDLSQTAEQKQFGVLTVHAYLLERQGGNVLFYNPRSAADFDEIDSLGGIAHHCLSHCHEVDESLADVAGRFGSRLCCHALVAPYLPEAVSADVFFGSPPREFLGGDIEVIHTPGHTDNSVCYRYRSPHGKTYLFTGDAIYLDGGEWKTIVVADDGGDEAELARSLAVLRDLEVDVVICSVSVGEMRIVEVTPDAWRSIIDGLVEE